MQDDMGIRYNMSCAKGARLLCTLLALSFGLNACSDDAEGQDHEDSSSPYWVLGVDNANMPSSGTIIAQYADAPALCDISKLVDADVDTKYLTHHNSFEITWNGNNSVAVKAYSLTSADDAPEKDPKSWTLSASQDNKSWKVIDQREGELFGGRKQTQTYHLENAVAYRYYKLTVMANNGSLDTQIAEWVLSAVTFAGNIDDLMGHSSGNTATDLSPMGTQHLGDLQADQSDLAWLKDASKEPDTFAGLAWSTFSVGSLYPFGTPSPADVNQHLIGDCCACAVMASMAYLYPKFIKSIIKENGDNTFAVTLYNPKGETVEVGVSNRFVADGNKLGAASGKNDQVTWATVLEKAVIKWHQIYKGTSDIGGIGTEYVSAIFTGSGSSFAFSPNRLSPSELQRAVLVSLQQRKMVIGGFTQGDKVVNGTYKTVSGHAYSFFLPQDDSYLFGMRNPWGLLPQATGGYSDGKEDGVMKIAADGTTPSMIDLRICDPGAAKGYASAGNLEPYTPPSYAPSPMRVATYILQTNR